MTFCYFLHLVILNCKRLRTAVSPPLPPGLRIPSPFLQRNPMIVCRRYIASKQAHGTFEFAIFDSGRYPVYGLPLLTHLKKSLFLILFEGRGGWRLNMQEKMVLLWGKEQYMITSKRNKQKPFATPLTPWDTFHIQEKNDRKMYYTDLNFLVVSVSILLAPTHSIRHLFIV